MAITFASAVRQGDFIQVIAHRAPERLRDYWWKVVDEPIITRRSETFPLLVNRHGHTARFTGQHVKVNVWRPGEDRRDPRDRP